MSMKFSMNIKALSLCMVSLLLLSSCRWFKTQDSKAADSLVIVNVLDKELHDDCHIRGSINLTMDQVEAHGKNNWDKDATHVVIYCANYKCTASGASAKLLREMGFKYVWAYEGGTAEWKHLEYPINGSCTQGYLNDYAQPEGHEVAPGTPTISAQDLKTKMAEFGIL